MGALHTQPLRRESIAGLPPPSDRCSLAQHHWDADAEWLRATLADWEQFGIQVSDGAKCWGYAIVLPTRYVPATSRYPALTASPQSAVVRCCRVNDADQEFFVGKRLVRSHIRRASPLQADNNSGHHGYRRTRDWSCRGVWPGPLRLESVVYRQRTLDRRC